MLDNADDPKLLRTHLPGPGPLHVVITSRRPDWGGLAKTVELKIWTPQQGAEFFAQRLGERALWVDAVALAQE